MPKTLKKFVPFPNAKHLFPIEFSRHLFHLHHPPSHPIISIHLTQSSGAYPPMTLKILSKRGSCHWCQATIIISNVPIHNVQLSWSDFPRPRTMMPHLRTKTAGFCRKSHVTIIVNIGLGTVGKLWFLFGNCVGVLFSS